MTFNIYSNLKEIITDEFSDIAVSISFIGGKSGFPNKLRIFFFDDTFMDVWLSFDGDYSYHWERRAKDGLIYRWDNAPDHPEIVTFPKHFHECSQENVVANNISGDYNIAVREVLSFVRSVLSKK